MVRLGVTETTCFSKVIMPDKADHAYLVILGGDRYTTWLQTAFTMVAKQKH
jgi:hypothetical protein